MEGKVYTRILK